MKKLVGVKGFSESILCMRNLVLFWLGSQGHMYRILLVGMNTEIKSMASNDFELGRKNYEFCYSVLHRRRDLAIGGNR